MVGAMVQGVASLFVLDELGSGAKTARAIASSIHPSAGALIRLTPQRLVWWKGWTSGSAKAEERVPSRGGARRSESA
jgi:hypothetical protein